MTSNLNDQTQLLLSDLTRLTLFFFLSPSPPHGRACAPPEPSVIPELVGLLRRGGPRERREAATALYELCKLPENRRRAVREGAAPALADFAAVGSARAVEVLGLLARCREGRHELCRIPGVVPVLVGVAGSGNPRAIEQAVLVLNWICSESNKLALEAIKLGAFQLCETLVNDDNCKIAKNAVELARTLETA